MQYPPSVAALHLVVPNVFQAVCELVHTCALSGATNSKKGRCQDTQHSTGGKERLGRISKQGNRYLRWLLVAGAMAVIRYARQHGTKRPWLARLMDRRPIKVAWIPDLLLRSETHGDYRIVAAMPDRDGDHMYRIKSPLEEYERVVKEDLLVKSDGYLPEETPTRVSRYGSITLPTLQPA